MEYANAAQMLASQGRNGDTMLVHMTPQEVGGLQALARNNGTSLTINPTTGMPEAFSLGNLLPMIAGAGLTAVSGGALSPLTVGLITGGIGALATGDIKQGLMMGLGGAGGAGLAGSFANLTAPATQTLSQGAAQTAASGPLSSAAPSLFQPQALAASKAQAMPLGNLGAESLYAPQSLGGAAQAAAPMKGAASLYQGPMPSYTDAMMQGAKQATSSMSDFGDFASENKMNLAMAGAPLLLGEDPSQTGLAGPEQHMRPYDLEIENLSGQSPYYPGSTEEREMLRYNFTPRPIYRAAQGGIVSLAEGGMAGAAPGNAASGNVFAPTSSTFAPVSGPDMSFDVTPGEYGVYDKIARTQHLANLPMLDMRNLNVIQPPPPPPPSAAPPPAAPPPMSGIEEDYNVPAPEPYKPPPPPAQTGPSPIFMRPFNPMNPWQGPIYSNQPGYGFKPVTQWQAGGPGSPGFRGARGRVAGFQEGGLADLDEGRFLEGNGDGMSDSIESNIDGVQEARLSDGEFVIPADVVSHLGNGSSKAGAARLQEMLERIRMSRTGEGEQAPEIDAESLMPA